MKTEVASPPHLPEHDAFYSRFGTKDGKGIARQLALYEEKFGPASADRWWRLANMLMALAPYPAKFVAQQAIQFYVPDGKYKMQVFALQVLDDGSLAVYAGDVLDESIRVGILSRPRLADGARYHIRNSAESLAIDALDGSMANPAPHWKAMTGWNRKAICVTLPVEATDAQIDATHGLCALAAADWHVAPPPPQHAWPRLLPAALRH